MKFTTITSALALASGALSAPSAVAKRNPAGAFEIIVYGIGDSVISTFYSDGLAYAGDSSLWTYGSVTTDLTFTFNTTNRGIYADATTSGVTLDADTLLYIRPVVDEVYPVGFTGNGYTTPSDAVLDEWIWYGTYLMYEETDGILSDSFRLLETNVTGVYQFYFDYSNLYPTGYLNPVVKETAA